MLWHCGVGLSENEICGCRFTCSGAWLRKELLTKLTNIWEEERDRLWLFLICRLVWGSPPSWPWPPWSTRSMLPCQRSPTWSPSTSTSLSASSWCLGRWSSTPASATRTRGYNWGRTGSWQIFFYPWLLVSTFRFLALQKMVEEKKAEAEKMNMKVAQEPSMDLIHQVDTESDQYCHKQNITSHRYFWFDKY